MRKFGSTAYLLDAAISQLDVAMGIVEMSYIKRVLFVIALTGLTLVLVSPTNVSAQRRKAAPKKSAAPAKPGPGQREFDTGIQFLEKGQAAKAISQLEVAAAKNGKNPQFQVGLVHAYAASRKPAKAWQALRRAVDIDDENPALGVALVAAWQSFGIEGLFNVGRPSSDIAKTLGKADRVERHADHERWIYGFMALNFADGKLDSVMDLRGLSRDLLKEIDRLTIETDGRKWRAGHRLVSNVHTTTEYVLPGEQVQNWKELVTVERLLGLSDRKVEPKQLMQSIKKRIQTLDPKATWKVLAENEDDVLYEWRFSNDGKRSPHHEMARLVKGQQDIYRIAYSARSDLGGNRKTWAKLLNSAKLVDLTSSETTPANQAASATINNASPESLAFDLGSSLGLSMALYNANANASATTKVVDKTRLLARMIGKQLPEYPTLSKNRSSNQSTLLRFAVKKVGSPYAKAVRDRYDDDHMKLFEMGLKANLLLLIYQPEQTSVKSIGKAISDSAKTNAIPRAIWVDLVEAIDEGAPFAEIKGHVMALNRDVSQHLAKK